MEQQLMPSDYRILEQQVQGLGRFPSARAGSTGCSVRSRQTLSFSVGTSAERVLFAGVFYGMEWVTMTILPRFARGLCGVLRNHVPLAGEDVIALLQKRGLCIIPCMNPDRVAIQLCNPEKRQQANARGVDINHNLDAGWYELREPETEFGITGPGPTRYGGSCPESESETAAMTHLCRRHCSCQTLALHSQGEVIHYDFGEHIPPYSSGMVRRMVDAVRYQMTKPEDLAVGGGLRDWSIDCLRCPVFTVEVGMGENPLPTEQFEPIYQQLEPMLVLAFHSWPKVLAKFFSGLYDCKIEDITIK